MTGATGLVGGNVVRALCSSGRPARALVRPGADRRALDGLDSALLEVVPGDVTDAGSLARAAVGVSAVVHAAALVRIGRTGREEMERVNVGGTRAVCGAARAAGVRMVHVSSVDALGLRTRELPADEETPWNSSSARGGLRPPSRSPPASGLGAPYVDTKRAAEDAVLEEVAQGLDAVIVNPCFVVGPWDTKPSSGRMILEVARGRGLFPPSGGNNFVHVADVVAGIFAARDRGQRGRRYILGNENLSYREFWTLCAEVTGGARPMVEVPYWIAATAGWVADGWCAVRGREGDLNSVAVRMGFLPHYFNPERARRELGIAATPVRQAVSDAWAWFRANGYV